MTSFQASCAHQPSVIVWGWTHFGAVLPAISSFPAQTVKVSPFWNSLLCQNIRPISPPEFHHLMRENSTIYDTPHPIQVVNKPRNAKSQISQLFLRDAQFVLCTQTRVGTALTWSPVLLSFPDGNAEREDMLFSSSLFSLSGNHGVCAWTIFTGSTQTE